MKTRIIFVFLTVIWLGLNAQQISVNIQKSEGECLLSSNCENNTICYDLTLEIDEQNWELRSYNIWIHYPMPPYLNYNSDNACVSQNGGDTDNNLYGQYRVGGVNGAYLLQAGVENAIHSVCFEYDDGNMILDSLIHVGGTAMVFGFPFESTITLRNTTTGETAGFTITSENTTAIQLDNKQILGVENGWSGISTWMDPDQTDIVDIMSDVVDDLVVMYNLTEGIYSPEHNINTINNWNYKSGYIVKVSDDLALNFCGSEPESKSINLMAGWNVIPVLSKTNVPTQEIFEELGDNLIIAKEIAGYQLYYPEFAINSLSSLETGKAYFVKVNESCTITFPEMLDKTPSTNQAYYFDMISPWEAIHETPESHVFCFADHAISNFETGDLVGAFDQQGNCTGIMEILNNKDAFAVSVFKNDPQTELKDGMDESEFVAFKLFRSSTGEEYNLDLAFAENSPAEGNFVNNGISIVTDVLISTTGTGINNYLSGVDLQIFPNPTLGETKFKLSGDVHIDGKIILTDSRGRLIFDAEHEHKGGVTFEEFDFSAYSPGIYYLRLSAENYINIQKIVVK
jgi:hypothetical protein